MMMTMMMMTTMITVSSIWNRADIADDGDGHMIRRYSNRRYTCNYTNTVRRTSHHNASRTTTHTTMQGYKVYISPLIKCTRSTPAKFPSRSCRKQSNNGNKATQSMSNSTRTMAMYHVHRIITGTQGRCISTSVGMTVSTTTSIQEQTYFTPLDDAWDYAGLLQQ